MRKALLFLGVLNDQELDWMLSAGTRQLVPAGTSIIQEGKPIESLFLIIDGLMVASMANVAGRRSLRSGEILGEISFVDSRAPVATVTAAEDSVVLAIPRAKLHEKIEQDVHFAARFYKAIAMFLSDRVRNTIGLPAYDGGAGLDENRAYSDEIDPDVLDNLAIAGARLTWLQKRLRSI
jgi:CRP-like cAMP-binding protein